MARAAAAQSRAMTAEDFAKVEAAYREAWETRRRSEALENLRRRLPGLEREVEASRERLAELERWLAELGETRAKMAAELGSLPEDTRDMHAGDEDRVLRRRRDLRAAIAALDGDDARGTLVDHLWDKPRIAGSRALIEEARGQLARAERVLADARRQLAR